MWIFKGQWKAGRWWPEPYEWGFLWKKCDALWGIIRLLNTTNLPAHKRVSTGIFSQYSYQITTQGAKWYQGLNPTMLEEFHRGVATIRLDKFCLVQDISQAQLLLLENIKYVVIDMGQIQHRALLLIKKRTGQHTKVFDVLPSYPCYNRFDVCSIG